MFFKILELLFPILLLTLSLSTSMSFRLCSLRRVPTRACFRRLSHCDSRELSLKIVPTTQEAQLFDDLENCVKQNKLNTTVRVVGGWVRDRLLGKPSKDDIDVTLDNMSGRQFVKQLQKYYNATGVELGIGYAKLNPDKSKHLETACATIRNKFSVDFVNLRTEKYTENSRVPVIEVGTPEEDAFRRDLTINSLSYNINTRQLEDFTKMGVEDLQNQVIRTPLDPLITLTDDPLRVLRVVRFACRFNFNIFPELMKACGNSSVLESLTVKISKERIHTELEGSWMLSPRLVLRAMLLLRDFGVFRVVLDTVPEPEKIKPQSDFERSPLLKPGRYTSEFGALTLLLANHVGDVVQSNPAGGLGQLPKVFERLDVYRNKLLTIASLTLGSSMYANYKITSHDARVLSERLMMVNICLSRKDSNAVLQIHKGAHLFHKLISKQINDGQSALTRLELGLLIRVAGEYYELSLLLGASLWYLEQILGESARQGLHLQPVDADLAFEIEKLKRLTGLVDLSVVATEKHFCDPSTVDSLLLKALEKSEVILSHIEEWNLTQCYDMVPLLNGNIVMQEFPKAKGPPMSDVMSYQIEKQLLSPEMTKSDMLECLKVKFVDLRY